MSMPPNALIFPCVQRPPDKLAPPATTSAAEAVLVTGNAFVIVNGCSDP